MKYIDLRDAYLSASLQIDPGNLSFREQVHIALERRLKDDEAIILPTPDECSYGNDFSRNLSRGFTQENPTTNTLSSGAEQKAAVVMGYLLAQLIQELNEPQTVRDELEFTMVEMREGITYVLPPPKVQAALLSAFENHTQSVCVGCPLQKNCHQLAATILLNSELEQKERAYQIRQNLLSEPRPEDLLEL